MGAQRRVLDTGRRYPRTARVNAVLREVLAEEIERRSDADERLRLLTVTAVDTTVDLRHATVFLASLPSGSAEALADCRVELQRAISRQVRLKRTPQLAFAEDPAVRQGATVEGILRALRSGQAPLGSAGQDPAGEGPVDG
ncbi:ribosome-binding factor A [Aciditerrimonas ferrireducens]|uniref:ribosome-binding factor A n=1 Tax=Aciditerrimonas ferrireducens TaxID=667306 RepID=UPI00200418FD|nr:ribosome-binding factor A [Aciditerrimonas ferrireducens]MCK4177731.1 ribosome-binding factor A [Aciditerrimonas ferrireducens]